MKPIIYSLIAMVGYAIANVLLEVKFSKYNNLTLMVMYGSVICGSAFIVRQILKSNDSAFNFPTGITLAIGIAMGLIFATADYFYVGAYTNGGNLLTITCITVMFPVFASIIKFCVTKQTPNIWQISGYILAALAVILVTKGSLPSTK